MRRVLEPCPGRAGPGDFRSIVFVRQRDAEIGGRARAARRWSGEPHHHRHDDDLDDDRDEALPEEDRVAERDDPAGHQSAGGDDLANLRLQGAGARHLQRRRSAQALRPDAADAEEARCGQRAVVDAPHAPRDLERQHGAEHEAEAPVDPGGHQREERHERHGAARRFGPRRNHPDEAPHRTRRGQHVARDDDERHLERERNQLPEAAAPRVDHLSGCRRRDRQGSADDEDRADEREDEGVGNPALGPLGERQGEAGEETGWFFPLTNRFPDDGLRHALHNTSRVIGGRPEAEACGPTWRRRSRTPSR